MKFALISLFSFASHVLTVPSHRPKTSLVHTFPPNTWLENLAVRSNNQVLLTLLSEPSLYLVDPLSPSYPTLIRSFAPSTALLGITEGAPDVFYLIAGIYDPATRTPTNGSFGIWEIDFNTRTYGYGSSASSSGPRFRKVADLREGRLPNGLPFLPPTHLLIAESFLGAVIRVDIPTGKSKIVIRDASTAPAGSLRFGINGLRLRGDHLYYTNSGTNALFRVSIHKDGTTKGKAEVISTDIDLPDDIDVGKGEKEVFVTENFGNQVSLFDVRTREKVVLASNASTEGLTVGSTSVRLGRGSKREVFVTTSGGVGSEGGLGSSGKLLRIEL